MIGKGYNIWPFYKGPCPFKDFRFLTDKYPIMPIEALKEELEFFYQEKARLFQTNKGQFVLIRGKELGGTFTTFEEAYDEGIRKYGNVSFLVKQILEPEPVHEIPALTYGLMRASV